MKKIIDIIPQERIKFWLGRVLEEKTMEIQKLAVRIGELNHQIANFEKMSDISKKDVIQRLNQDFKDYDWNYLIEELGLR
jgi:hypothetical protein